MKSPNKLTGYLLTLLSSPMISTLVVSSVVLPSLIVTLVLLSSLLATPTLATQPETIVIASNGF